MRHWIPRAILAFVTTLSIPFAHAQFATSGPILPIERQTSEPSRAVPATGYRDAYCARWTDGCTICERNSANDEPSCRETENKEASCSPRRIECRAVLPTIGRVCLHYFDGCNHCTGGSCTAMGCLGPLLADGQRKLKEPDFICRRPRRERYDDSASLKLDLYGHWRLVDARGRGCEFTMRDETISLSESCLPMRPAARIQQVKLDGTALHLLDPQGKTLLSFDASKLETLPSLEGATQYQLVRLQPSIADFWWFEGSWRLSVDGAGSSCEIYLPMLRRRLGPKSQDVMVPQPPGFHSFCTNPDDDNSIRLQTRKFGEHASLPRWRRWTVENHQIIFFDAWSRRTIFTHSGMREWTSELAMPGKPPILMKLRRKD